MDRAGARRTVREVTLAGVVVVVVTLCLLVVGGALLSPMLARWSNPIEGDCSGTQTPTAVLDYWAGVGSEDVWSSPSPSASWLPYGSRCTWTLPDGSTVWKDAPWGLTLTILGSLAVASGAVGLLAWSSRRSARRGELA